MRNILLLAGAAALVSAAPALAKPGGHGSPHVNSHANAHAMSPHAVKSQKAAHVTKVKAAKVKATRLDRDGDGIRDSD